MDKLTWKTESGSVSISPERGRVLGIELAGHEALWSPATFDAPWNLGGERLWIGPEVDWFWQEVGKPDFSFCATDQAGSGANQFDCPGSVTLSGDPADPGQPRVPQFSFFKVKGARCAIAICADSGINGLDDLLEQEGVEVLLVPTGAGGERKDRVTTEEMKTPEGRAKYLHWLERVFFPGKSVITCIERRRILAAVNLCGFDGRKHYHIGHGMIITPMGEVPALIHGLPNIDRQRSIYAHAAIDLSEHIFTNPNL